MFNSDKLLHCFYSSNPQLTFIENIQFKEGTTWISHSLLIKQNFTGYRCKLNTSLYKWRVPWKNVYSALRSKDGFFIVIKGSIRIWDDYHFFKLCVLWVFFFHKINWKKVKRPKRKIKTFVCSICSLKFQEPKIKDILLDIHLPLWIKCFILKRIIFFETLGGEKWIPISFFYVFLSPSVCIN